MHYALRMGQSCSFKTTSMQNSVNIFFGQEDDIKIVISDISERESNILNWIMASQCIELPGETNESVFYQWISSSLNDAVEKVYRIFTEYYSINKTERLIDTRIKQNNETLVE